MTATLKLDWWRTLAISWRAMRDFARIMVQTWFMTGRAPRGMAGKRVIQGYFLRISRDVEEHVLK